MKDDRAEPLMDLISVTPSPLMEVVVRARIDGDTAELFCLACHSRHTQSLSAPPPGWRHADDCFFVRLELSVQRGRLPYESAKRLLEVALLLRVAQIANSLSTQMLASNN